MKAGVPARAQRDRWIRGGVEAFACLLLTSCNLDNPGVNAPAGRLAYPIALAFGRPVADGDDPARSGRRNVLYVANSNFDLSYNSGSLHAYDLEKIDDAIAEQGCEGLGVADSGTSDAGPFDMDAGLGDASAGDPDFGDAGLGDAGLAIDRYEPPPGYGRAATHGTPRGVLCDGRDPEGHDRCCFSDNAAYLVPGGELKIDSYTSAMAIDPSYSRLYLAVRSSNSLLYVDTDEAGKLDCGSSGRCERAASKRDEDKDPDANFVRQPTSLVVAKLSELAQPTLLEQLKSRGVAFEDQTFIALTHELGSVSLLLDEGASDNGASGPVLHHALPDADLRTTTIALDPTAKTLLTGAARAGNSNAPSATLRQVSLAYDFQNGRYLLNRVGGLNLGQLPAAGDIRDIELQDPGTQRLSALMRGSVQAVLFVERDETRPGNVRILSAERVGAGPSKMTRAVLGGRNILFVSCFDARTIFVFDEERRELVNVVRGLSGPFDMLVDPVRQRLYVADFASSVLRVVDVKGIADRTQTPPRIIATLGTPRFGGQLE